MTTARLSVDSVAASKKEGIASLSLALDGGGTLAQLDLEFSQLAPLRNTNLAALDFLLLASTIYGLDKLVPRQSAGDSWTRDFNVALPVSDPARWTCNRAPLLASLDFLSGDRWDIDFVAHSSSVLRPRSRRRRRRVVVPAPPRADLACLFSGGLDSLVGVIDILESEQSNVMLVGHHDGQMAGPLSDQNSLLSSLRTQYPNRIHQVLVRVGHSNKAQDISLRCRSILFIALGIYGASTQFVATCPNQLRGDLTERSPRCPREGGLIRVNPVSEHDRTERAADTIPPWILQHANNASHLLARARAVLERCWLDESDHYAPGWKDQRRSRRAMPESRAAWNIDALLSVLCETRPQVDMGSKVSEELWTLHAVHLSPCGTAQGWLGLGAIRD